MQSFCSLRQLQEIKFAIRLKEKPSQQGLKRKISRLMFKLIPGKGFALAKYSPVNLHSSPATTILNEPPGDKCEDLDQSSFGYLKSKCLP